MVDREIQLLLSKIIRLTYRLIFLRTGSARSTVLLVAYLGDEHEVVRGHVVGVLPDPVGVRLFDHCWRLYLGGRRSLRNRLFYDDGFLRFLLFEELPV
jgi:hypothetical protein